MSINKDTPLNIMILGGGVAGKHELCHTALSSVISFLA